MPIRFTPELGAEILEMIHSRNWKVVYENRNHGNPDDFQPIEEIFEQEVSELFDGPRYHIYPAQISFDVFIGGVVRDTLQMPRVIVDDESRLVFGFGIRDDHCFFVTNLGIEMRTADRGQKSYEFMLEALDTLQSFSL